MKKEMGAAVAQPDGDESDADGADEKKKLSFMTKAWEALDSDETHASYVASIDVGMALGFASAASDSTGKKISSVATRPPRRACATPASMSAPSAVVKPAKAGTVKARRRLVPTHMGR